MSKYKDYNVHQRVLEIKKNCDYIKKDKEVRVKTKNGSEFSYSAVTHDAVNAIIRDHFNDYGVLVIPTVKSHEKQGQLSIINMVFTFVNVDSPEDQFSLDWYAYGEDFGDKGPGKAASYCAKNMYIKLLQIETGEDDESRIQVRKLRESELLQVKERAEELDLGKKAIDHLLKKTYQISALDELPSSQLSSFMYHLQKTAEHREKYRKAFNDLSDSITAISDGIDNEDWGKAAEAWYELSHEEQSSIWISPTKAEMLNLHPPFTTKQRDILHAGQSNPEEHKSFKEALNKFYQED